MAAGTFYGTNAGKVTGSGTKVNSNNKGKVRCLADRVEATIDIESGSTCYMGILPKGAVVLFTTVTPVLGTGIPTASDHAVTGSVGIVGDTNLFGTFTTLAATVATQVLFPIPDGTTYTGLTPLAAEKNVIITTAGATLDTNSATATNECIDLKVFYLVD